MPFISEFIDRPVVDLDGEQVGNLKEILAVYQADLPHPKVVAIGIKKNDQTRYIAIQNVAVLSAPAISLNKNINQVTPYNPSQENLYLVRDVLDKQILDTNGVRVVRVNDLELTRLDNDYYIANVDISGAGLLRRLGLRSLSRRIASRGPGGGKISWDNVDLISSDQPIRLKVPVDRISELHPADLAEILTDLSRLEGREFLESLDLETMADTLEEVEPEFQASLLEGMSDDKVADVLEEMEPDEAADLLAELPDERSQQLLDLMEDDEAKDVRMLLTYPEDSAGGIMTTGYIAVQEELTVEEVMKILRQVGPDAELIYYLYVTDKEDHLEGVFSLRDLVLSQPNLLISDIMEKRVVTVNLEDSQDDCAQIVAKYDLIAIPVVDDEKRLRGIVTADDALDKIIPTAWKKRLPHLYH